MQGFCAFSAGTAQFQGVERAPRQPARRGEARLPEQKLLKLSTAGPIITDADFDAASFSFIIATTAVPGSQHSFVASLPDDTTFFFAMKVGDDSLNFSAVSNTGVIKVLDRTDPGRIADLRVTTAAANSATLAWTAPGDNGAVGDILGGQWLFRVQEADILTGQTRLNEMAVATDAVAGSLQSFTLSVINPTVSLEPTHESARVVWMSTEIDGVALGGPP